jgi:hypothetical protein
MKIDLQYEIGEVVYDTLTRENVKILGISYEIGRKGYSSTTTAMGNIAYWVDNSWLDVGRFPWEIDGIPKYTEEDYLMWW